MMNSTTLSKITKGLRGLAAIAICAAASSAQAAPIQFDFTGSSGAGVVVASFDEAAGNALALGAQALINATPVGGTTAAFDLYYQAKVTLKDANNNTINTGNNYFTAVAKFREVATVLPNGTIVLSMDANQSSSYLSFFAHTGVPGNIDFSGVGFSNDTGGTLIYSATAPTSGPAGNFTNFGLSPQNLDQSPTTGTPGSGVGQQTVTGSGGGSITTSTAYFNTAYFRSDPGFATTFNFNNNLPFRDASPSQQFQNLSGAGSGSTFTGYILPVLGSVNGQNGRDVQFQADASNSFTAVPEPASVALTAMGLVGLVGFAARRRQAAQV